MRPFAPHRLPHGNETILVVEDEPPLRTLVTHFLRCCGFNPMPAASAPAALEIWEKRKAQIDLVLTDIEMPEMTGLELAERLQLERAELKVIFMSGGVTASPDGGTPLIEGVNCVSKPYSIFNLAQLVRDRLDQSDRSMTMSSRWLGSKEYTMGSLGGGTSI